MPIADRGRRIPFAAIQDAATAVYDAAPTAAQSSLGIVGWSWDRIVQAEWYNGGTYNDSGTFNTYEGVGQMWKDIVGKQEGVLQRAFDGEFGLRSEAENAGVKVNGLVVLWAVGFVGRVGILGLL